MQGAIRDGGADFPGHKFQSRPAADVGFHPLIAVLPCGCGISKHPGQEEDNNQEQRHPGQQFD